MLEIKSIKKAYNRNGEKITPIENIDLKIDRGEFICLLGPSGCGKSTLLNIISGLDNPDSGNIYMNGKKIKGPGKDRIVMFQDSGLFPWLTVKENIEFGLRINNFSDTEIENRVNKYLRMVHLFRFKDSYIHEISGGMRQRAALARALALDSEVLLMDEPFSALDSQTKTLLQQELQKIWWETGKTVIFVTHNVEEAVLLGTRIILMGTNPGRIKREIKVDISIPRKPADRNVRYIQEKIIEELKEEVEKVASKEFDEEWTIEKDTILHSPDNDLGANI
ncbi:MAG: ABC transporter ATP-binding protein [Andreesenia angusta]|nr:ABC transporter ATP-binding protein [Andreesenia angusta]